MGRCDWVASLHRLVRRAMMDPLAPHGRSNGSVLLIDPEPLRRQLVKHALEEDSKGHCTPNGLSLSQVPAQGSASTHPKRSLWHQGTTWPTVSFCFFLKTVLEER